MSKNIFGCHTTEVLLLSSGQRPEMLLNTLWCTELFLLNKALANLKVDNAEVEKSNLPWPTWFYDKVRGCSCCLADCYTLSIGWVRSKFQAAIKNPLIKCASHSPCQNMPNVCCSYMECLFVSSMHPLIFSILS